MVTLKRLLILGVIHTTFLLMPAFAFASTTFDDFTNFNSVGWTGANGIQSNLGNLWGIDNDPIKCDMPSHYCFSNKNGGTFATSYAAAAGLGTSGFITALVKIDTSGDSGSGDRGVLLGIMTAPGDLAGSFKNQTNYTISRGTSADGAWHTVSYGWRNNGGIVEECSLIDDTDVTDCVWNPAATGSGYLAPGQSPSYIYLATYPGQQGQDTWVNSVNIGPGFMPPSPFEGATRIVSFTPEEGTTTGNDVTFALHVYVNPDDLTGLLGVQLDYKNIDQNHLLSYIPFVSQDIVLFAGQATTSGDIYFTATTSLPNGNYRVQASIKRTLIGTFINPFSHINDTQNHQFIVNEGTYLGNLNQNGFNEFNNIFGSTSATSTAASSLNCNPLTFSINLCLAFLFIPGGPQLDNSIQSFQDGVATRWPWGYFYRVYAIFTNPATNTLPSFTTDIVIGPPGNLATTSLSYDPGDMIAGAGALLDTVHDNQHGKSFREVMEPFVLLMVALMVVFTIFSDITGSHKHHQEQAASKLS